MDKKQQKSTSTNLRTNIAGNLSIGGSGKNTHNSNSPILNLMVGLGSSGRNTTGKSGKVSLPRSGQAHQNIHNPYITPINSSITSTAGAYSNNRHPHHHMANNNVMNTKKHRSINSSIYAHQRQGGGGGGAINNLLSGTSTTGGSAVACPGGNTTALHSGATKLSNVHKLYNLAKNGNTFNVDSNFTPTIKTNKVTTLTKSTGKLDTVINTTNGPVPIALSPTLSVAAKSTTSTRSKNEEAIHDLKTRIPEIENIFDVHSRIGNGTFSTVLMGTLKKERDVPEQIRRKFAIKHHIPTSHPDRIMKELQCMAKIGGSNNVVGINCCIRYNESVAFIMPYMQHDRFHDFFHRMDLTELQNYMKNLLIALRHVHKFNVIHRDVKPSNFLYNRRKRQFLLVDFGLAQQVPVPQKHVISEQMLSNVAKRLRDEEDIMTGRKSNSSFVPESPNDDTNEISAKRARCSGGAQCDPQVLTAGSSTSTNARLANSCIVAAQSQFKMPLKQLNEINNKALPGATGANGSQNLTGSIYDTPIGLTNIVGRQIRSQLLSTTVSGRNITKHGHGNSISGSTTTKYNTNRNMTLTKNSQCHCYGNPQVCNICLVKKEVHASRAGTPGYRPPEVLLKYPDQTTAVDIWAAGVIFLSILSSVYPFFKAPNDFVALAEMVTIFGDKTIRKTAFVLDRLVTLSQKTKPLDLRKLCVRFRNRSKFSSPELLHKYQRTDGSCEVCKNCDQFYFNCLCSDTYYKTEPLESDDPFPDSAYDLLYRLLEVNPHKRITAEEALTHPFFFETNNKMPNKLENSAQAAPTSNAPTSIRRIENVINAQHPSSTAILSEKSTKDCKKEESLGSNNNNNNNGINNNNEITS